MLEFFQALVATKTPRLGFQDLLQMLSLPIYSPKESQTSTYAVHKQVGPLITEYKITNSYSPHYSLSCSMIITSAIA